MHITEFVYENREAFLGLLSFLHSQADQVHYIYFNTQDENFHHVPFDPRDDTYTLIPPVGHTSNSQGVGIMYRVIDIPGFFRDLKRHNFSNQDCKLKLTITDSFYPENEGSHIIHFVNGKARIKKSGDFEVEIQLDIADFSSMVMGVLRFKNMYAYGQAEISDKKYIDLINRLFTTENKPICTTQF
jgi:predicted acetyltransferase